MIHCNFLPQCEAKRGVFSRVNKLSHTCQPATSRPVSQASSSETPSFQTPARTPSTGGGGGGGDTRLSMAAPVTNGTSGTVPSSSIPARPSVSQQRVEFMVSEMPTFKLNNCEHLHCICELYTKELEKCLLVFMTIKLYRQISQTIGIMLILSIELQIFVLFESSCNPGLPKEKLNLDRGFW